VSIVVTGLRSERLTNPIGIGTASPRLSWRLEATDGESDIVQLGWQIEVEGVWDSGRVDGREQSVRYDGERLGSRTRRRWRVRAFTSAGSTEWSEPASFETGLLHPSDWTAQMITASASTAVVRFTKTFEADSVAGARLYLTAQGAVVAFLNGHEVGAEVLAPGWTSYHHRLAVRTHDVTHLLRPGTNELIALVAPAWFSGRFGLRETSGLYGKHLGLLAQLEAGGAVLAATEESWSASSAPFALAEIYDGETYDERLAGEPCPVTTIDFDPSVLVAPSVPPVVRTQVVQPVHGDTKDGALQLDFGQNLVGRMRIGVQGVPAGTEIVMRHAELLGPDGRLFTEPLRTAKATDTYIVRGDAVESYEPTFTFHGFRYAEIAAIDPANVTAEAVVVHSDLERLGTFACSDPLINKLHECVVWGQRGNFVSVPTDCPQRDERLGWTGDAQVFSPTASFLYDCETFWENWLADLAADQHDDGSVPCVIPDIDLAIGNGACGWADAACVVPWTTYEAYGDDTVLRNALPSMIAWADYVYTRLDADHRWRRDFQFGDWLDPDAPTAEPWRAKAKFDLVASAYAVRSTELLARAATVLGEAGMAARYTERAALLREAWQRNYAEAALTTQTGCALAIEFGLAPDSDAAGNALVQLIRDADNHLATGFLGTPLLLPALEHTGHLDVAYDVLFQRTCPSWLYQVIAGATTIWERWDALRPDGSVPTEALGGGSGAGMVSFNHYAYGAVADWLHRTVAGLAPDPDEPGYRHVIVKPQPGGRLSSASASLKSRYGHTSVDWRVEGPRLVVDVEIPPNASATIELPDGSTSTMGSGSRTFTCSV
jgi:alpha-L-rhamnosidase